MFSFGRFRPAAHLGLAALAAALAACDSPSGSDGGGGGEAARLAVGEALDLAPGADHHLGTADGAEYALAYIDTRTIRGAETQAEPYHATEDYGVTITDVSGGASQSVAARASIHAGPADDPDWSVLPGDALRTNAEVWARDRPWAVGDVMTLTSSCPAGATCPREARVHKIYDGWLAVAAVDAELGDGLARILAVIDRSAPLLLEHGIPLLRSVYGDALPVSSTASGQMMMLLEGDHTTSSGRAATTMRPDGQTASMVYIEAFQTTDWTLVASLMVHEVAHTFQQGYLARTRVQGARGWRGTQWSMEGGANLMSYEAVRRAAGVPLAGNFDFRRPGGDPMRQLYARRAQPGEGEFTEGYESAMGFLRDVAIRRVEAGENVDVAVREVSLGALDGWYGIDGFGTRRPGLTQRMRSVMSGWSADEAMLTWALSHAGDDRTDSPLYQDRASLRVWDRGDAAYGWMADGTLTGGAGKSLSVRRPYGSPGFASLRDTGRGVSVRVSSDAEDARFRVLRIR